MLRINLFQFYAFGKSLNFLATLEKSGLDKGIYFHLLDVGLALEELRGMIKEQDDESSGVVISKVVKQTLDELIAALDQFQEQLGTGGSFTPTGPIPVGRIKDCLAKFETVFESELSSRIDIYSVSSKGAYSTSVLIERADAAISKKLRPLMSDVARYDLRQSGRCLAFEAPTASGFHALRAVEAVVKQYYEKLAGKPWPHTQRDWGRYIDELRNLNAPDKIINALGQTRSNYRNPLMHPEDTLEIEDAINLFSFACALLTMMLQEIGK